MPWHRAMLDARYSHLYFCQSLNRLQRDLSAIAELLVNYKWPHHYSLTVIPYESATLKMLKKLFAAHPHAGKQIWPDQSHLQASALHWLLSHLQVTCYRQLSGTDGFLVHKSLGHHLFPPVLLSLLDFPVTGGICLAEAILWLGNWLSTCVVQGRQ